jgi:hypothetical protein
MASTLVGPIGGAPLGGLHPAPSDGLHSVGWTMSGIVTTARHLSAALGTGLSRP